MREQKKQNFVSKLKNLGPKFKWLLFTELQDFKLTSQYVDLICPGKTSENSNQLEQIEQIVRQSLIREFSPDIQHSKSFDLLVDAVVYKIQKKSLKQD